VRTILPDRVRRWRARHRWNQQTSLVHPGDIVTVTATLGTWTTWTTGPALWQPHSHPRLDATRAEQLAWERFRAGRLMVGDDDLSPRTAATWPEATLTLDLEPTTPLWSREGLLRDPATALRSLDLGTPLTVWWRWHGTDETRCCVTGALVDFDPDAGNLGEIAVGLNTDDCQPVPLDHVLVASLTTEVPR
jgi:hypothetical protein